MSGWFILAGYAVLIAALGWPGLLAAAAHVAVLLLVSRMK